MNRTKIDALYDLAVKVGGSAKKDDSIVEMIDQITEGYSGGGSGGANTITLTTNSDTFFENMKSPVPFNENDSVQFSTLYESNTVPSRIILGEKQNGYYFTIDEVFSEEGYFEMTFETGYGYKEAGKKKFGKYYFTVFYEDGEWEGILWDGNAT